MNKYVDYFESESIRTRELLENLRWYQGAEDRLEYFFKQEYQTFKEASNNPYDVIHNQVKFWRSVGGDVPRVHSGLPKLITKTMVNLVAGNGYDVVVMDGEKENIGNTERLKAILEDNKFDDIWVGACVDSSWAGYSIFKLAHDKDISRYPLIEKVMPSYEEIRLTRGRVTGVTFKLFREDGKITIHEKYDIIGGKLEVTYKAYENKDGKEKEIELPEDIASLETKYPFNFLPMVLHKNTIVNSRFPDSPYGESDYTGVQSLFHMIDDLLSQTELEVANAQAVKFVNETLLKADANGKAYPYDKNEVVITFSNQEETFDVKKHVQMLQPSIRVAEYQQTIKDVTARTLTVTGLNPLSAGLPGFESVQASAQSQREREKTSLRTRENRLQGWKHDMETLFERVLMYDDYLNKNKLGEYKVEVSFSEWAVPTLDERIETITKAIQGNAMDVNTAVEELYDGRSEEEKAFITVAIKLENGIPLLEDDYIRAGMTPPQTVEQVSEETPTVEETEEELEDEIIEEDADDTT